MPAAMSWTTSPGSAADAIGFTALQRPHAVVVRVDGTPPLDLSPARRAGVALGDRAIALARFFAEETLASAGGHLGPITMGSRMGDEDAILLASASE